MEAKGDDPDPVTPTAASLLALVRDAATTDELTTRLASLAAAIAGFQITVAKAEVLAAAKAKRAALGAGGWTKECAVALKGVLQAFGKGVSSVTAVAELGTKMGEREREIERARERERERERERKGETEIYVVAPRPLSPAVLTQSKSVSTNPSQMICSHLTPPSLISDRIYRAHPQAQQQVAQAGQGPQRLPGKRRWRGRWRGRAVCAMPDAPRRGDFGARGGGAAFLGARTYDP